MSSPLVRYPWLSPRVIGWGTAALLLVGLFVMLPYQHGTFADRLSVFVGWWRFTNEQSEWAFCPLVPLVSAWFGWQRRAELQALPLRGHWSGLAILALALFSYWIGFHADTCYPGFAAFQLAVAGFIIWMCGLEWMRVLLFPWLFLVFMWPVYPLEDQLAQPLRMITAGWASRVLSLIGQPTVNEGAQLLSAANPARELAVGQLFRLDVAEACSGIRSLYALMMLAAIYGYVFLRGLWPRVALFFSAIPLAMVGNLVRMVLLAFGSVWFGPEIAIGRTVDGIEEISLYHELAGYMVFAVALVGMFAISSFLEGKHWKHKKTRKVVSAAVTEAVESIQPFAIRAGIAIVLGGFTVLRCVLPSSQPELSPPPVTMEMPTQSGAMQSQEMPMTAAERMALNPDITLTRRIYVGQEQQMLATLVLSGQTRRGLHRPDVCLPGAGWNIMSKQPVSLHLNDGREVDGMLMRLVRDYKDEKTGQLMRMRGLNIFWYQGWGTSTSNYYHHVFTTYFDSIFRNLNHRWALVSFFTQLPPEPFDAGNNMAEAKSLLDLEDFVQTLAPALVVQPKE